MVTNRLPQSLTLPGLAAVLLTNVFFFVPFTIYMGNTGEFASSIWPLLRLFSIPALSSLIILIIFGWICRGEFKYRYQAFLAIVGLLVWVQGNILVWDYGLLDGRSIDWSVNLWRGWFDLALWAGALISGILLYKRIGKILIQFAFAVFAIQSVQMGYVVFDNAQQLFGKQEISSQNESLNQIFRFSKKQNVVHMVLDGFQADVFSELINQNPLYKTAFSGFTFFEEALGAFPYTRFAVPAFLTGRIYHNNTPKDVFVKSAFEGKSILNTAYSEGYEVDLAGIDYWAPFYRAGKHTTTYFLPNNFHMTAADFVVDNAATLLDLSLFRIAPHFIKKHIYNNQKWFITPLFIDKEYQQFFYFAHTAFMNKLTQNMTADRVKPVYKYIHIMTTHTPMVVTPNCDYAGGVLANVRPTLTAQSKCTLDTVIAFLEKMKELGIYNNAQIILHADHGGWIPPHRFKRHQLSNGMIIEPWMAGLASPLLAVKPPHTSGDIKVSKAPVSITDLPDTISSIQGWDAEFGGVDLLNKKVDMERKRNFYFYTWQRDAWETDYTGPIQEFIIDGSHYDQAWRPARVFLPPAGVQ